MHQSDSTYVSKHKLIIAHLCSLHGADRAVNNPKQLTAAQMYTPSQWKLG